MAMPSFRYGDKTYEYAVQFLDSRKKTVSIHVLPDASVEVLAPARAEPQKIRETIKKRARWIARHVDKIQFDRASVIPREYVSGETHFYLGRRYVLKVIKADVDQVKLARGNFYVECRESSRESVKALLVAWYKEHANQAFKRRLASLADKVHWLKSSPPMTVRDMKKQWGSCSPKGCISLNWNLVKAPLECVDYVIMHELCHLQEHNHSKKFYTLMDKGCPNWRPIKGKLDSMAEFLLNE